MKRLNYFLLIVFVFSVPALFGQRRETDKIKASTEVLREFGEIKKEIPEKLFEIAEGVIIIPHLINAGFVVAGERGKGVAVIKNPNGTWSSPVFITLTGGSAGFQAGVEAVDLILVFNKRETLQDIGKGSFTLGGDIAVTAGPFGRSTSANTDYKFDAQVYSYSKSKGLFGGFSINGSSLVVDRRAIKAYYGQEEGADVVFHTSNKSNMAEIKSLKSTLVRVFH